VRRPLFGLALCAMAGIWAGRDVLAPAPLLVAAAAAVLLCGGLLWRPSRAARRAAAVLAPVAVILCWALASSLYHRARFADRFEPGVLRPDSRPRVRVVAVVAGDPERAAPPRGGAAAWEFPVRVRRFEEAGDDAPASGRLRVRWYGPAVRHAASHPAYGETWSFRGRLRPPRPGYSRYRGWRLTTGGRDAERLARGRGSALARLCHEARRASADLLARGIEDDPETVGLLHALLLGYRSRLTPDAHAAFASTGTLHIFAISGLHVAILCGMLIVVLTSLGVPRTRWILFLAPALAAYTFATGAKPSAVRACIMATIYLAAAALRRRPDSLSALAAAAMLILGFCPGQLWDVGFVFSFTVVLGIVTLFPFFYRLLVRAVRRFGIATGAGAETVMPLFWQADPARPPPHRPRLIDGHAIGPYFGSLLALSCSAWVVSAPLTACTFGRFAPIAILGNVFVVPLALLIVTTGCLSLVLGSCAGLFAEIFNHANLVLVNVLVAGMRCMDRIPGAGIDVPPPPPYAAGLWYAALGLGVWTLSRGGRRRGIPARWRSWFRCRRRDGRSRPPSP